MGEVGRLGAAVFVCAVATLFVLSHEPPEWLSQVHLAYSYSNHTHTSMYMIWHTHRLVDYCLVRYSCPAHYHALLVWNFTHDLSEDTHTNYVFKTHLAGLHYDTEYGYSLTCFAGVSSSTKRGHFAAKPGRRDDVTILIMGDWATDGKSGSANHAHTPKPNVLSMVQRETGFTSVWHLGDLAYNLHNDKGMRGDRFFESIEPLASRTPFMAVPGNHEVRDKFRHFNSRLEFPSTNPYNLYYSVDIGKAHIVMICTDFEQTVPGKELENPDFQKAEYARQKDWLIADLKAAKKKKSKRPWIIVMGHKPLYCSSNPDSDMMQRVCIAEAKKMRESFEDIFVKYGVTMYISGHLHLYERLDPVIGTMRKTSQIKAKNHYTSGKAPIYLINGVAGNLEAETIVMKPPAVRLKYSAVITEALGYGFLRIINATHLYYEQIAFGNTQFDDATIDFWPSRRVVDVLWISREDNDKSGD